MDQFTKIIPFLWEILGRTQKGAANITTKENEIIVSIWSGKRWKRFKNKDTTALLSEIQNSFQLTY